MENKRRDISRACSFTGHRPQKCLGSEAGIRKMLAAAIMESVEKGFDTFISGMAEGVDVWAAEEVLRIKKDHSEIKLVCAVPYVGVEKNRTTEQQVLFRRILAGADGIEYICPKYRPWCFSARNRWLVDHSSRVIAVFNGSPGGTEYTIRYAREKMREIIMLDDAEDIK